MAHGPIKDDTDLIAALPAELHSELGLLPQMNRRDFLRVSGTVAAATALTTSACELPPENSLPFHERPEGLRTLGKPKLYATVLEGAPVLVKNREGRPILITPNASAPAGRGLSVRTHAALLDLYDPDRAQGPIYRHRGEGAATASSWQVVGDEVVRRLRARRGDVALLTRPVDGPAARALLSQLHDELGLRHVGYATLDDEPLERAYRSLFGPARVPRPRLDRAELIVGFGAEFIDLPEQGLEGDFARRRDPKADGGMNRFVQLEGRLSLTGANADRRIRVRDSQLGAVAASVAHEIIVRHKVGPLADDTAIAAALAPYAADKLARTGVKGTLISTLAAELLAARDRAVALTGPTACATTAGAGLEAAVLLINLSLGSFDGPAFELRPAPPVRDAGLAKLATLAADLRAGTIKTLIIACANPVFDAPGNLDFAAAMARAELIVSLNDRVDETSALADYLAPASHALESWSDAELGGGHVAVQQPVIRRLYDTHDLLDVLITWGAAAGATGAIGTAAVAGQPPKAGATGERTSASYHFVRAYWSSQLLADPRDWDQVLRTGHAQGAATATTSPAPNQVGTAAPDQEDHPTATGDATADDAADAPAQPHRDALDTVALVAALGTATTEVGDLELQLYPDFCHHDGRAGNNGWLHEMPDPITRICWGGALSIAPRRFDSMGLKNGDLVEVAVADKTLTLPAYRHAGMHDDQIAAPLGLGRTAAGEIGAETGVNAFPLTTLEGDRLLRSGLRVRLSRASGHEELALGQGADVLDRQARQLLPTATLDAVQKDPRAGTQQVKGGPSAWPEHPYDKQRWAMAIDLSRCNGCGKCTLGCQAENNVPVVGKQNIINGREMAWLRIDRYYDAPPRPGGWNDAVWDGPLEVVEEPITMFEPMLCQHCENAPCETVCPFNATMHSADGLNQQIYNRCVGTRYCANNCVFKIRRYNWFEYSRPRTNRLLTLLYPLLKRNTALNTRGRMQMKNNPEVTVRSRGVMEKCSFCVQRIREARAQAIRDGTPGVLADGAVVPACMEACPTGAITFGDVNDPSSRVAKQVRSPRAMRLLEATGVKPSVYYLTRVRNDNA